MKFWVWCEVLCSECNKQLAGEYAEGSRMPIGYFRDEFHRLGWVARGQDVFCSTKCRDRYAKRSFNSSHVVTHVKKDK